MLLFIMLTVGSWLLRLDSWLSNIYTDNNLDTPIKQHLFNHRHVLIHPDKSLLQLRSGNKKSETLVLIS